jgi:hypothetical protein
MGAKKVGMTRLMTLLIGNTLVKLSRNSPLAERYNSPSTSTISSPPTSGFKHSTTHTMDYASPVITYGKIQHMYSYAPATPDKLLGMLHDPSSSKHYPNFIPLTL